MYRLKLFGSASIEGPAGPLTGRAVQRRRLALLALLASGRGRTLTRDRLVAWLWPDAEAERARAMLSDSIYRINQAVAGEAVATVGDGLRLDAAVLPSDAGAFEDAIARGEWASAVSLYSDPFLDGFYLTDCAEFERWVDAERERLAREYARALEALADEAVAAGDARAAVDRARALAAHDPFNSRFALRYMQALEHAGERATALQHARVHTLLVREEIGVEPDVAVLAFEAALRAEAKAEVVRKRGTEAEPEGVRVPEAEPGSGAGPGRKAEPGSGAGPVSEPEPGRNREPEAERGRGAEPEPEAYREPEPGRKPGPAPEPAPGRGAGRLVPFAPVGVAGVLAVVLLVLFARSAAAPGEETAIAVLPFSDLSTEQDQEYFADGITEELIVRLARVEGMNVVGRTSAFALKGSTSDVREIGERLGVDVLLAGSVRRAGDRLRVVAQLTDASSGYELWSETYERQAADVFAIQDDIARAIVQRMRGGVSRIDSSRLALVDTDDLEAYNLYLRGRFEWHRRTEQGLRNAARLFAQATQRAPSYARAWVGLGDAYAVLGFYDYLPPDEAFPRAAEAARTALELRPDLAEAHATLGYVALYHEFAWARAEEQFRRVVELYPDYSTGRQWYANHLTAMGRFGEAVREMRAAQALDPLSLIANAALGWVLYYAGDYEAAIAQCTRTLELDPQFELAYLWRGMAWEELGRYDDEIADLETAVHLSGGSAISTAALARAFALRGRRDDALRLLQSIETHPRGYVPSFEVAKVHAALGDADSALDWLERALGERSHSMAFLAVDPQLASLHGEPRYEALVAQLKLRSTGAR